MNLGNANEQYVTYNVLFLISIKSIPTGLVNLNVFAELL